MRDDFTEDVKRALAQRVANRCSNPECGAVTSGPQIDPAKAVNVGVAAHLTAASPGGPRYDDALTPAQRGHASNGLWLCQTCAKRIDSDPVRFTSELLREWKAGAEAAADAELGKSGMPRPAKGLRIALPEPVNPIGHLSSGAGYVSRWRFRVRIVAEGQALDIVDLGVTEDGVGAWTIREVFRENIGGQIPRPIAVERSVEFWIDAESPRGSDTKPTSVGRMTLWFRDHTQREGERHECVIDRPPIR